MWGVQVSPTRILSPPRPILWRRATPYPPTLWISLWITFYKKVRAGYPVGALLAPNNCLPIDNKPLPAIHAVTRSRAYPYSFRAANNSRLLASSSCPGSIATANPARPGPLDPGPWKAAALALDPTRWKFIFCPYCIG